MKKLIILCLMAAGLVISSQAKAITIEWKGLEWTMRGSASATIREGDSLEISVIPGSSNDPSPDNWVLTTPLPITTQWVEFSFIDTTGAGGLTVPRAYVDTSHDGGSTLIQGGGYSGYSTAYINYHWYKNGWLINEWINLGTRTENSEHTFKVGRRPDGSIDLYYDGVLKANVTDINPPFFGRAYLGIQAEGTGTAFGTYTNFSYGDTYIPEPATMTLLAIGALNLIRRRK
ncbi:MAG: hypothetical protein A2Y10_09465 [Planctomycetes bacterium GWF2_41_51]|nr:MAG: hypothetical protein A2Y10_09465 [Planctomycetes bacterium GWF2_41_51]